jgi:chaperone BCS1
MGPGGLSQAFNIQQIGGALGIFAVFDRFFGGNPYLSAGFGILFVTTLYQYFWKLVYYLWNRFKKTTYFSISVDQGDESYRWLMEWFSEQPYCKEAREMSIRASWGAQQPGGVPGGAQGGVLGGGLGMRRSNADDDSDDEEDENGLKQRRPRVMWLPAEGTHYFRYQGTLITFTRGRGEVKAAGTPAPASGSESLNIKAFTTNRKFLRTIVRDARKLYYSRQENKTNIFIGEDIHWKTIGARTKRELSSVVLDEGVLKLLSDDLRTFINDRDWYMRCGVPYRRGYLLYGPPGTGKTSFILSIAGKFELSVCVLVLSSNFMNDQKLSSLIKNSPANSILLLEDVDVAFTQSDLKQGVSFSGLLNAIDGIAAGDGRILFMTTNHIERLSTALIRPGRVDVRVKFDLASKSQIKGMFWRFYKDLKLPDLEKIEKQVVDRIEDRTVSTAQLQGLFIRNKNSPQDLLDGLDEFIEQCKKEWSTEQTRSAAFESTQSFVTPTLNALGLPVHPQPTQSMQTGMGPMGPIMPMPPPGTVVTPIILGPN